MKCNQSRPGFELVSPCPYPATITITPRAPPVLTLGAVILFVQSLWPEKKPEEMHTRYHVPRGFFRLFWIGFLSYLCLSPHTSATKREKRYLIKKKYIYIYIYIYNIYIVDDYRYILPYPRRVEFSSEEVNRVAISAFASLFVFELRSRRPFERMYVNNINCDS